MAASLRTQPIATREAVRSRLDPADHGRGRHELELGPTLVDTFLPETHAAGPAAQLLAADAAIRVHDGDPDGALDSCRAILGVARSIGDEPFLTGQFVRMAIGRELAMKSARRVLGQGEPSDGALARLQTLILDELAQPILLHGLKGERAMMTELIRRCGAGAVPIPELSGHDAASVQHGARLDVPPGSGFGTTMNEHSLWNGPTRLSPSRGGRPPSGPRSGRRSGPRLIASSIAVSGSTPDRSLSC